MRTSKPLFTISPAAPATIEELDVQPGSRRLLARLIGSSLVLIVLGAACVLILDARLL